MWNGPSILLRHNPRVLRAVDLNSSKEGKTWHTSLEKSTLALNTELG